MGIQYQRAGAARVNLTLLSGPIPPDEIMAYFEALDVNDPDMADAWITYDCGDADLSELDLARVAQLKALIFAKVAALASIRPMRSALVSGRTINEPFFQFWKVLVSADVAYPSAPEFFHQLPAACDWLGLDAAQQADVIAAARSGCAR